MGTIHILPSRSERERQRLERVVNEALANNFRPEIQERIREEIEVILEWALSLFEYPVTLEGTFTEDEIQTNRESLQGLFEAFRRHAQDVAGELFQYKIKEVVCKFSQQ